MTAIRAFHNNHALKADAAARDDLGAEVKELRQDLAESDALQNQMASLLDGVAHGLKGEPPPLTCQGWWDLPAVAAEARAEVERLRKENEQLHCQHNADPGDRDAAAARVAELEEQLAGMADAVIAHDGEDNRLICGRCLQDLAGAEGGHTMAQMVAAARDHRCEPPWEGGAR